MIVILSYSVVVMNRFSTLPRVNQGKSSKQQWHPEALIVTTSHQLLYWLRIGSFN